MRQREKLLSLSLSSFSLLPVEDRFYGDYYAKYSTNHTLRKSKPG
jgi:hypothetical protein